MFLAESGPLALSEDLLHLVHAVLGVLGVGVGADSGGPAGGDRGAADDGADLVLEAGGLRRRSSAWTVAVLAVGIAAPVRNRCSLQG